MLALDISCQHLGDEFKLRVSVCPSGTGFGMYIYEKIYLYWIYAANHLGSIYQLKIYVDIGYIMPTLRA